jgi:Secretion system C-terminal sorting domain
LKEFIRCQFLIISFLLTVKVEAQREGNIWCFGDSVLIDWNDPQNPILGRSASKNRGSASSISDSLGNLLFYVGNYAPSDVIPDCSLEGFYEYGYIYTKNHTYMENGRCVSGEGWYNEHTIIPMPDNDSLYYKFSVNLYEHPGIDFSVIDMNANGGMGKVIERDVSIISYDSDGISPVTSCIKAVRHGNGRDWWLISKSTKYNLDIGPDLFFLLMLVTPNGIEFQEIPANESLSISNVFTVGFNSAGTKMFSLSPSAEGDDLFVYDFDRCTGVLSNQKNIEDIYDSIGYSPWLWDAEFSPSGRYLYVNNTHINCEPTDRYFIFQYDLDQENPALTRDTLLNYTTGDGYLEPDFVTAFGGFFRLAPDGKIYYARKISNCFDYWWPYPDTLYNSKNMNLSVINSPDSAYPATNFEEYSFSLGGARTYHGLPNNPNFALGAMEGTLCDTLSTGVREIKSYKNNQLNIFPNPCYNNCQIQYKPALSIGNITISNMEGKVIFKEENIPVTLLQHGYEVNTSAFAKGVYFVTLVSGNQNVTKKLVRL